jgi:LmbE family N-acetylglucosaminyl deacetylase
VLVVAPHPDDEILGCGGAVALHLDRGDVVHVALVTAGDQGGAAGERLDESRRASAGLGAPGGPTTRVTCLGAPDGGVAGDRDLVRRLAALVDAVRPRVVYAPSPFEMHPDHVASLDAVAGALAGRRDVTLLLYEVNTEGMASFLLDITAVHPRKQAALSAFASQLGLLDIAGKAEARARARTINVDIRSVTHAEAFLEVPGRDPGAAVVGLRAQVHELARALGLQEGRGPGAGAAP